MHENICLKNGGDWQGAGTTCEQVCGNTAPIGACCFLDYCMDEVTEILCEALMGDWMGEGTVCVDLKCGNVMEMKMERVV